MIIASADNSVAFQRKEGMGPCPALSHATASSLAGRSGGTVLQSAPSSRLFAVRQVPSYEAAMCSPVVRDWP